LTGRKARRAVTKSAGTKLPDLKDHEAVQRFFLQEVSVICFIKIISMWQIKIGNITPVIDCIGRMMMLDGRDVVQHNITHLDPIFYPKNICSRIRTRRFSTANAKAHHQILCELNDTILSSHPCFCHVDGHFSRSLPSRILNLFIMPPFQTK
jgi:hypothetical protein